MMQEVEAKRPAYVVFVDIWQSWLARAGSPQVIASRTWMYQYISNGFEKVGMVELAEPVPRYPNGLAASTVELDDLESSYFWGDEAGGHSRPGLEIRIFKRKA